VAVVHGFTGFGTGQVVQWLCWCAQAFTGDGGGHCGLDRRGLGTRRAALDGTPGGCVDEHRLRLMKIRAALTGKDFSGTEWIAQWLCAHMGTPTQTSLPLIER
jgi:hypothetical protein